MFFDWVILIASFILQFALIPKPQNAKPASLEDFDLPVCEEGKEFGVLSGTELLKGPNVTWWGDLKSEAIKGPRRYGFFGPRQVVGYKYYLGIQFTLCQGPADILHEIWVADKLLWRGTCTGGIIDIDEEDLFGGKEREGGISGQVEVCMGAPDQAQNDYLAQEQNLGPECPAFRGVVTVVLRQVYLGTSPYIKPWAFKLQRIHKRSDNSTQWYDAKSAVPDGPVSGDDNSETGLKLTNSEDLGYRMIDANAGYYAIANDGIGPEKAYVWDLTTGDVRSFEYLHSGERTSLAGYCFITDDAEIITRGGGDWWGSGHTYLDFRDLTQDSLPIKQTIPLHSYINGSEFNSGFGASEVLVGTTKYLFIVIAPYGAFRPEHPYLLLSKGPTDELWSTPTAGISDGTTISGYNGAISLGADYAYLHGSTTVGLVKWSDGTFEESLVTPPGMSPRTIKTCSYLKNTDEVLIICSQGTGPTYALVYDSSLTTLKREAQIWTNSLAGGQRSLGNRILINSSTAAIPVSTTLSRIDSVLLVDINSLEVTSTIDITNSNFVYKNNVTIYTAMDDTTGKMAVGPNVWSVTSDKMGAAWPLVSVSDYYDMNPAHIIREYLTDKQWAMGYNDSDIDDDAFMYAADLFYDEFFGLTIYWVKEEQIDEMISIILAHVDAVLYVSRVTGKFILKPIRDDYVIDDLPIYDDDDVVEYVEVKRSQPAEAVTSITAKYTERRKNISKDGSVTYHNDAAIQQADGIIQATREYPGISRNSLAARVAERDQHTLNPGIISGTINGKRSWQSLNPGSPFRFVSSRHNLQGEVMRVTGIKFYDGKDNKIGVTFVQDMFRLGLSALVDQSETKWDRPGYQPLPVDPRLVWEMPYYELRQMTGPNANDSLATDPNSGMIEVAGEKPTPDTLGVAIYVDGVETDILEHFSPSGFLTDTIGKFDTSITLTDATVMDSIELGMLAAIVEDDVSKLEIVRIDARSGSTVVVSRGMLDTVPHIHLPGVAFIVFDDFSMPDWVTRTDGDVVAVKLRTRTPLGQLTLSAVPTDNVSLAHRAIRPIRPANILVEGQSEGPVDCTALSDINITWANRNRITETVPLVWTAADVTPEAGQTVVVEACDDEGNVLTSNTGLTGTAYALAVTDFLGRSAGIVRVGAERDGFREWQGMEIEVLIDAEALALDSDPLYLDDQLLYIGD